LFAVLATDEVVRKVESHHHGSSVEAAVVEVRLQEYAVLVVSWEGVHTMGCGESFQSLCGVRVRGWPPLSHFYIWKDVRRS
jgi:hypothetical protein